MQQVFPNPALTCEGLLCRIIYNVSSLEDLAAETRKRRFLPQAPLPGLASLSRVFRILEQGARTSADDRFLQTFLWDRVEGFLEAVSVYCVTLLLAAALENADDPLSEATAKSSAESAALECAILKPLALNLCSQCATVGLRY